IALSTEAPVADAFKDAMKATSAEISQMQKQLEGLNLSDTDRAAMQRVGDARKAMMAARDQVSQLKQAGNNEAAMKAVMQTYVPASDAYLKTLADFVQLQQTT